MQIMMPTFQECMCAAYGSVTRMHFWWTKQISPLDLQKYVTTTRWRGILDNVERRRRCIFSVEKLKCAWVLNISFANETDPTQPENGPACCTRPLSH